ncbi:hypothetical protein ACU4GD_19825 [Cupriavidus basilensis]
MGWLYGRRAHLDMSGINRATLDVIAPLLVCVGLRQQGIRAGRPACAVGLRGGRGAGFGACWPGWSARLLRVDPRTFRAADDVQQLRQHGEHCRYRCSPSARSAWRRRWRCSPRPT